MISVLITVRELGVTKEYHIDLDNTKDWVNVEVKNDDGKVVSYFETYGVNR